LNVWVALLNLENMYGNKETIEKSLADALKMNDPKKVFMKMVDIYVQSDKKEAAEKLYMTMVKRFSTSKKVWISYGNFLMTCQRCDDARKLLQRSLKSLQQRKHIETIVKFAMMEFKHGDAQRGMTVFESVLKNYPKRTDLWSIYIDMTIKQGDLEQVRNIFERATALTLTTKKMKFLFRRYLEFETKHGTENKVEYVRNRAMDFVERQIAVDT